MNIANDRNGPVAAHALGQARANLPLPPEPWSDRTTASHWHEDREWAVIVDWAQRTDGTRVPASVTLSSIGATLSETPKADIEPAGVTRALVDSIPWARVIADSRTSLEQLPGISGDWAAFRSYEPTPAQRAQEKLTASTPTEYHDQMLRLVARVYEGEGGEKTHRIASRVTAKLISMGATPMRRGKKPPAQSSLSEETVRRWIKEARKRGYLDPSTRRSSGPKTSGHEPGDK